MLYNKKTTAATLCYKPGKKKKQIYYIWLIISHLYSGNY